MKIHVLQVPKAIERKELDTIGEICRSTEEECDASSYMMQQVSFGHIFWQRSQTLPDVDEGVVVASSASLITPPVRLIWMVCTNSDASSDNGTGYHHLRY